MRSAPISSRSTGSKPVIVCGDLNVAHQEIDLKNPGPNRGNAGFSDEERGKFTELLQAGFTDTFRYRNPDLAGAYSWWSYRFHAREKNAGWRIDYFLVSDRLRESDCGRAHLSGNLWLRPLSGRPGAGYGGICMKKQRIIRWLSALMCLCLLAGFAPAAMAYSNVSDWAKSEVAEMEALGLLPDCLLNADLSANITRGEMCKMAVEVYENLMNVEASCASGARYFTDTQEMEINFAFEQGIINGYEDQTFPPE